MSVPRPSRSLWIAVVILAALLRVGVVWNFRHELHSDPDAYRTIAIELAAGHGYINSETNAPTAFRPPLYPLILSLLLALNIDIIGLAILHVVIGTATVWLTCLLGKLVHSKPTGILAGLLVAIDPLLLRYTSQPMTETLFTFLVTACLLFLLPIFRGTLNAENPPCRLLARWFAGILFGLCALCRPTIWMFAVFCVLWQLMLLWKKRTEGNFVREVRRMLPVVFGGLLVVSPWAIRNVVQFGSPIFTTTHGGYTLLLGNNDVFYREVVAAPWGTVWRGESLLPWQAELEREMKFAGIARTDERARDAWMYARAKQEIRQQPHLFLRACLLRVLRFWNIVPQGEQVDTLPWLIRWGIGGFYLLMLCGLLFAALRSVLPVEYAIPFWLLLASFTLVHTFYWSNMRMRSPLIPVIAILVASGICSYTKAVADVVSGSRSEVVD